MIKLVNVNCPGCGAPLNELQTECAFCRRPIILKQADAQELKTPELNKHIIVYRKILSDNPDSREVNNSVALCFLNLKMYDKALEAFEKCMEDNFDNSETFFYAAVCLLRGRKPFLCDRKTIDKIIEYISAANMIEPRGLYYYYAAYIKQDYFARKHFAVSPDFAQELSTAQNYGYSPADAQKLFDMLGQPKPEGF